VSAGRERTGHTNARHGPGVGSGAAASYFVVLSDVLRQRVQTSAFRSVPFSRIVNGWRFGWYRRWARTRFIPDDCGLKPPIDTLPQIAQERAMVVLETVIACLVIMARASARGHARLEGASGAV